MNMVISQDAWAEVCTEAHLVTNSNTAGNLNGKQSPDFSEHLKQYPKWAQNNSISCWRNCEVHVAEHTHAFWLCPRLKTFWGEVFDALNEVFQQHYLQQL